MNLPHKLNIVCPNKDAFDLVKTHSPFRILFWTRNLCGNKRSCVFRAWFRLEPRTFYFPEKCVVKKIIEKEMYGKMEKAVYFSEKDRALIEQIEAYQKEQDISFDVAVKQLCENALTQKNGLEWGTFDK